MVNQLSMSLDGLSPLGIRVIVENGTTKTVTAFMYHEAKFSKFCSFTRNQRYFARIFKDQGYVKMYANRRMVDLGLEENELFYVTAVETMIKNGTNHIVRSLSIDSFSVSKEASLKST